ncbi:MAG: GntR family transcriptional regulator [Prolixibacteraceae bacterium]|nr:GntR family transcriptional regulator [Prolixibacteraceae bacterium]
MVKIGKVSSLEIVKFTDQGAYLDGGPYGEILLPNRYLEEEFEMGDDVDVFVHFDSDDRIVATTDFPYAMVGEFAFLEVVDVTRVGAFVDWGLPKNLLVPFGEQLVKMEKGKSYVVHIYVDTKSGRIAASSKINKFMNNEPVAYEPGDEVDLLIAQESELGFVAIINKSHQGILYRNEIFKPLQAGQKCKGFIKKVRSDGKIDLVLEKFGYRKVEPVVADLIEKIKSNGGMLHLSDRSDPVLIKKELGISKKTFKKAIGALYKNKQIEINDGSIRWLGNV